MAQFRPEMKEFSCDPARYKSRLGQPGIRYPTLRDDQKAGAASTGQSGK